MNYDDNKPIVQESIITEWVRNSGRSMRDFSKGAVVGGLLFSLYFFGVTARDATRALQSFTPQQIEMDADAAYLEMIKKPNKPLYHKPAIAAVHYASKVVRKPVYLAYDILH